MQAALRFLTCGSVDDGKSTLIGRLLWDSNQVFEHHVLTLAKDSARFGPQGEAMDLALLLDGFQTEREQNITFDVAYRYFATPRRRFIVADTPGHEQYTANIATEASNSELAILVVNASTGLQLQSHRHARIASLLGIRHLVLAVNKMDLVHWAEDAFAEIVREFQPLAKELGFESCQTIPISALNGDNISNQSSASPWYRGPNLLGHLEEIDIVHNSVASSFRMPVQWVNRKGKELRGYCGRVASGKVNVGDQVRLAPGAKESKVSSILAWEQDRLSALAGDSITIHLEDEVDLSRGDVIASASDPIELSDQFETKLLCVSQNHLVAGRSYLFRLHTCQAIATITAIKYKVDIKLGIRLAAKSLGLNDIGVVNLALDRPVPFEACNVCRHLGSFILVDRFDNLTVGTGMIDFALRRAANIHWQTLDINKEARARQKLQRPACLWFTGFSGSGKSTIANLLEKRLFAAGRHTYILDGDNIRHGLNRDLGFSEADRVENIRRITEVSRLLADAGLIVIVSFISPYRAEREIARSHFEPGEFLEIFVDTPLDECERRDPKGLYAKARNGELINFTGIDSNYEPPQSPDIRLYTVGHSPDECVDQILLAIDGVYLRK